MLTRTAPLFPDHLREEEREGIVRLAARIGADGSLADVSVVEASHPDYAAAAEDAVRGWTWEEPLLNCTPIEVRRYRDRAVRAATPMSGSSWP